MFMPRKRARALGALLSLTIVVTAHGVGGALPTDGAASVLGGGIRTIDGSNNNRHQPAWGRAGTPYLRIAAPAYADGASSMVVGPNARAISDRVFNDSGVNLFSETGGSQWLWAWGQFIDHDFGLRDERPAEDMSISFNATDPLEDFTNDFGVIGMNRTPAAPGTGTGPRNPRQQINTVTSFLDGSQVYGSDQVRATWLRDGAKLMLPGGYLPRADARGDVAGAPAMDLMGRLTGHPEQAVVAGDVRANENIALTAITTLFAREHNRIVDLLPTTLGDEVRYQIARRVVGAEIERITYTEFLPAMGLHLSAYTGYKQNVNASLGNEFATTGFRAHSMVHGEFEVAFAAGDFTAAQLASFSAQGIEVEEDALVVPLTVAFGNPDLLTQIGEGKLLTALGAERQYRNEEQIDNSLRSVLFGVPKSSAVDPTACQTPVIDPACFSGVVDLGAIDLERAHDHGIPNYNDLRRAYGLAPKASFTAITGESTDGFPTNNPLISATDPINDPDIMTFVERRDANGVVLDPNDPATAENAVSGTRATTLAARLKALYGTVNRVDAFTGMLSEPHVAGTDMGELQTAIWKKQFQALRDGDRFFYLNDPAISMIDRTYGIKLSTLAEVIDRNSGQHVTTPFNAIT